MAEGEKLSFRKDSWFYRALKAVEEETKDWPPEIRAAAERRRQKRLDEIRRIKERKYGRPASRP